MALPPRLAIAGGGRDCEEPPATARPMPGAPPAASADTATEPAGAPGPAGDDGATPVPSTAAEALGRQPARVKCLDESLIDEFGRARSRKGVQPRPFRKALRATLSVGGGAYAGDLSDTSWQAGGNLGFWISEDFGVDAQFRLTPMTFRLERSFTGFTTQNRYPNGQVDNFSYTVLGHLLWAPLHTKLRSSEERIVHGDFVLFAGAGPTFHDSTRGVSFDVGMSLYLYLTRWLSLRLDLSDHIVPQEILGSRRISNSLVFSAGLGMWIPFRR